MGKAGIPQRCLMNFGTWNKCVTPNYHEVFTKVASGTDTVKHDWMVSSGGKIGLTGYGAQFASIFSALGRSSLGRHRAQRYVAVLEITLLGRATT